MGSGVRQVKKGDTTEDWRKREREGERDREEDEGRERETEGGRESAGGEEYEKAVEQGWG